MPNGFQDRKVRSPCVFLRKIAFDKAISMNYDIVMRFEDQSGIFPVDGESIIGLGLLARLK
jgi:hypothetical protein